MLLTVLKEKQLWPSIKIKKFKCDKNLCLLHNSYKKNDIKDEYKTLYNECRSVILDFSRSCGNNVVISYANSIPERIALSNYNYEETDKIYAALDGTLVTVYYHNNNWFFGSSCCPDINGSKFSHPTKTHGYMLDEALYEMFKDKVDITNTEISKILRGLFTANLNPLYSYEFVLIHHENKHIVDYTKDFYKEFKLLFHINTKNRLTLLDEDITNKPFEHLGIRYPYKFDNYTQAYGYVSTTDNSLIVKKDNKLLKISNDKIMHYEEVNANNYNLWYNLFYVYMLQKPNYNVNEYLDEFNVESKLNQFDEINLVFNVCTDVLYNLYISTTLYYPKYKRFKTNLDFDRTLNPVMRFHLAQLRQQQTTIYTKAIINKTQVFNYLCHSNNIKNIKKILNNLVGVTPNIYNIPQEYVEIIKKLVTNLSF